MIYKKATKMNEISEFTGYDANTQKPTVLVITSIKNQKLKFKSQGAMYYST